MKYTQLTPKRAILTCILGCSAAVAAAQDVEEPAVLSPGEQKVIGKWAGGFEDFAGENAPVVLEALRTGGDLSYEVEKQVEVEVPVVDAEGNPVYVVDAEGNQVLDDSGNPIQETTIEIETVIETVVVENTTGPQGMGNARTSMILAEAMLAEQGLEGSMANISGALFGTNPETADGIRFHKA